VLETASRERQADAAGQQMTQTGMCEDRSDDASFGVISTQAETAGAGVRSRTAVSFPDNRSTLARVVNDERT
jgi:hypothetical protein